MRRHASLHLVARIHAQAHTWRMPKEQAIDQQLACGLLALPTRPFASIPPATAMQRHHRLQAAFTFHCAHKFP